MSETGRLESKRVQFNITPFASPAAADYYANLTGAGNGPSEIVLVFAQVMPSEVVPEGSQVNVPPRVRVTLSVPAARNLLSQLKQQLELQVQIARQDAEREGEGARGDI